MLFSGIPFLFFFLPCVLILYMLTPRQGKNAVLLLASLIFYGWGEPIYVIFMVISILVGYIVGILVEKVPKTGQKKAILTLGIVVAMGMLGYFKYTDFFIQNFSAVTGIRIPLLRLALPIGISFYSFQILSYEIDVYRKTVPAQKNLISLATYVTMFPQLIAGPIVRYSDIALQLDNRTHSFQKFSIGVRRFTIGLGKKVLLANTLGELCDLYTASSAPSVLFTWMYAVAFTLHVYFDFSGYSDMAIGLGHMLGFHFPENFDYPYMTRSVKHFWRHWHMSLGSWFRDYLYFPLGGNRCSTGRWVFNTLVVWIATGFWHGAAWTFIFWGLMYAVLLIAEKLFLEKLLSKFKILPHIYTMGAVMIGFVLFNADSLSDAVLDIGAMFGFAKLPLVTEESLYYLGSYAVLFLLGIVGCTSLPKRLVEKLRGIRGGERLLNLAEPVFLVLTLVVATAFLVDGSFNPFLYFRF